MTEREADLVMIGIEGFEWLAGNDNGPRAEAARAMLNHLYELHKLRDLEVWSDIYSMLKCSSWVLKLIWELQPYA